MTRVCHCVGHLTNPGGVCCKDLPVGCRASITSTWPIYTPNEYPPPALMPQAGWVCPRCNRVNAPSVPYCACSAPGVQITSTTTTTE